MLSRSISVLIGLLVVCNVARVRADTADTDGASQQGPSLERNDEPDKPREKKKPMGGYAFGLKLGMGKVGVGKVDNPAYIPALVPIANMFSEAQLEQAGIIGDGCSPIEARCRTPSRFGLQLSLPIQIGGTGVGFVLEPMFTFASEAKAYGLYMGPTFNFHIHADLYFGFGFGLKAAWVKADGWKYAGDLHGRVPLTVTYYVVDDFALVAEFAFGGGASMFANEHRTIRNPLNGQVLSNDTLDVTFGFGRAWDLTFGVRFP